jgi:hypothetical protein
MPDEVIVDAAQRMVRQRASGLATRPCAHQYLERDRTQNRYTLSLIALHAAGPGQPLFSFSLT